MGEIVRPFFGFYGGKWRDTPKHYPTPIHETIVEPFAGSAGYSLRHADRKVVLCDLDPVIAGVWGYLIGASSAEVLALPDVEPDQTVDDLGVCQEARWLIGFWLNRGVPRPRRSPSRWMRDGIRPGSFWGQRVRATIAGQVEHIRHWQVFNCAYQDCPVSHEATWFIDAPYQRAGRHYTFGSAGIDYAELGGWCRSRPGQLIVCEAGGADWLPFEPLSDVKTTRATRALEQVWAWPSGDQENDRP